MDDAKKAIDALREFFTSIGIPENLRAEGFSEEDLPIMAKNCVNNRKKPQIDGFKLLKEEDILKIYKMAL